jgi:hypothetical protein
MDFEKAVSLIGTVTDLRRVASAHVIDHNRLKNPVLECTAAEPQPQHLTVEPAKNAVDELLHRGVQRLAHTRSRITPVDAPVEDHFGQTIEAREARG